LNKLIIDARHLKSGIGTYTKNILSNIHEIHEKKLFDISLIGDQKSLTPMYPQFSIIHETCSIYSIKEQLALMKLTKNVNNFHSSHYNIPILYNKKLIVTVYDVAHLILEDSIKNPFKKFYADLFFNVIAKKADAVITISNFSKEEILKYTNIPEKKINVIYCGCDHLKKDLSTNDNIQRPYVTPYILYVGNIRPHKNIDRLVKGFIQFKASGKTEHKLIIAGHPDIDYINSLPKHHDIEYRFDQTSTEIEKLYKFADLFAFVSLYEGFGLPPLEALAYNIPIMVSDIPVFREILEDVPFFCNPNDVKDIANKLNDALFSVEKRKECVENGKKILQKFSWREAGIQTYELYKKIYLT
jgi:glycosyltransferase involved in cell wall biosynthesis